MKPVTINLSLYVNISKKALLVVATILTFIAFVFVAVNTYNYVSNRKIIEEYKSKVEQFQKLAENKEQKKIKKELNYLISVIEKDLFPLPQILTEIEQCKPEKVDIHRLIFSENLKNVTINGESDYVESVSAFLLAMEKSKYFSAKLIRQRIKENHSILFELKAEWNEDEKS
jgi:hypothetical protein